jgi:hypothetical protein
VIRAENIFFFFARQTIQLEMLTAWFVLQRKKVINLKMADSLSGNM